MSHIRSRLRADRSTLTTWSRNGNRLDNDTHVPRVQFGTDNCCTTSVKQRNTVVILYMDYQGASQHTTMNQTCHDYGGFCPRNDPTSKGRTRQVILAHSNTKLFEGEAWKTMNPGPSYTPITLRGNKSNSFWPQPTLKKMCHFNTSKATVHALH